MINRDAVQTEHNSYGPFINIGFGFMVNANRITSILPFTGQAVKRLYTSKLRSGEVFDATRGRKKQSLVVFDNGKITASAFKPDTIVNRQL